MNRAWGFTFTEVARDARSVTYNIKVSPLRMLVVMLEGRTARQAVVLFGVWLVVVAKFYARKLALLVGVVLALALLSGCSAREALREIRDNARFSVYAIDHPRHGHCREVSLTSSSATAGESGAVYAGLCSHSIDSGAAADAAGGE